MHEIVEKSIKEFTKKEGKLNCAQAVFSVFSEKYGLKEEMANNITRGFGGGFLVGSFCGAASGAVAVIGLKGESAEITKEKTKTFLDRFKDIEGSFSCEEILNMTPEKRDSASEEEIKEKGKICVNLVKSAVETLLDMGY